MVVYIYLFADNTKHYWENEDGSPWPNIYTTISTPKDKMPYQEYFSHRRFRWSISCAKCIQSDILNKTGFCYYKRLCQVWQHYARYEKYPMVLINLGASDGWEETLRKWHLEIILFCTKLVRMAVNASLYSMSFSF